MNKLIMLIFLHVLPSVLFGMEQGLNNVLYYCMDSRIDGQSSKLTIVLKNTGEYVKDDYGREEVLLCDFFNSVKLSNYEQKSIINVGDINFIKKKGNEVETSFKIGFNNFVLYVKELKDPVLQQGPQKFGFNIVAFTEGLCKALKDNADTLQNNEFKNALEQKFKQKSTLQETKQNLSDQKEEDSKEVTQKTLNNQKFFTNGTLKPTFNKLTRYVFYYVDKKDVDKKGAQKVLLYKGRNGLNDFNDKAYQTYIKNSPDSQCVEYYVDKKEGANYAICQVTPTILNQSKVESIDFNLNMFDDIHIKQQPGRYNQIFATLLNTQLGNELLVKNNLIKALNNAFNPNALGNEKYAYSAQSKDAVKKQSSSGTNNKKYYLLYYVYKSKGKSYKKIVFSKNGSGHLNFFDENEYGKNKQYVNESSCEEYFKEGDYSYHVCAVNNAAIDNVFKDRYVIVEEYNVFQNKLAQGLNQSKNLLNVLRQNNNEHAHMLFQTLTECFKQFSSQSNATSSNQSAQNNNSGNKKPQSLPVSSNQGRQQPTQQHPIAYFFSLIWQWLASWWPF